MRGAPGHALHLAGLPVRRCGPARHDGGSSHRISGRGRPARTHPSSTSVPLAARRDLAQRSRAGVRDQAFAARAAAARSPDRQHEPAATLEMVRVSDEIHFVSVVVATHDGQAVIEACLRSLLGLDHAKDRYEIVVVDAASSDATNVTVRSIAGQTAQPAVRLLSTPSRDANTARNAGLADARGELVVFVDDDVVVPTGWLAAIVEGAARWPAADCLGGPVLPVFEDRPPRTCARHELAGARFDDGDAEKPVRELWGA